jgi:hypothetical protein
MPTDIAAVHTASRMRARTPTFEPTLTRTRAESLA